MQPTPQHLRPVLPLSSMPTAATERNQAERMRSISAHRHRPLSRLQALGGGLVFLSWLALFGAGIMVDTEPYRVAISAEGARQLRIEGQSANGGAAPAGPSTPGAPAQETAETSPAATPAPAATSEDVPRLSQAWLVVLFCFLPLNLAWLCVSASTLGAVGNLANLGPDHDTGGARDTSNPILSAVLRGFFVYLFLMSGLLLLDHAPFANAGPSQYIRLAGFLSLFSFVVSYHPNLFGALIVSAFERIQVRAGDNNGGTAATVQQHTSVKTTEIESTSTATVQTDPSAADTESRQGSAEAQPA